MTNLHISQHALEQWLYQMVNSKIEVFAPVHDGEKTDFRLLAFGDKVADDYVQTTQSAKRFAFPKAEKLFSYRKEGKDVTLQERDLNDFQEIVLWKVRPWKHGRQRYTSNRITGSECFGGDIDSER